jgi:hypothetical protein
MDAKLQKIRNVFNKIKDTRIQVMNVFSMLEVKLTKLKLMTSEFIKGNHDATFVFGLDSFKFQSRLIDFEYADMQKYFYALNNRMYCEYYKLFKIVSDYVDKTIGTNKTFEMIKSNSVFPIYKDLEPYKQYNFETIEEVHKTIILLLGGIQEHIVAKEVELENYRAKQHSGLNINNFVNTFLFNVTMIKHNLGLFISYLDFFHNIHMKHFKRFAKKMKSMDDYLNEDITFDDSPRRKTSRDFDETSSLISSISGNSDSSSSNSNNGGGGVASHNIDHHEHNKPKIVPRKSETKSSLLKKGVDSVINTFRVFGTKSNPVTPPISSNNSISSTNTPNNSPNLSLHIDEKEYDLVTLNNSVNDFNSTNLTRERKDTINEQLSNDPDLMNKMFDQLTKSLDSPDEHNEEVKEEIKSESNVFDIDNDDDNNFGVAIVPDIDCEATGKKKETVDDLENNLLEQSNAENEKPEENVEDTNKQSASDQKTNKKKRYKKK